MRLIVALSGAVFNSESSLIKTNEQNIPGSLFGGESILLTELHSSIKLSGGFGFTCQSVLFSFSLHIQTFHLTLSGLFFCYKRQPDRCSHRGEAFCIVSLIAVNVLGCFLACGLAQRNSLMLHPVRAVTFTLSSHSTDSRPHLLR